MVRTLLQRGLDLLLRQQTNILSAAFILMVTVILSQILGLIRQRLLLSIFGASDTYGVYLAATRIPDFLFQIVIAGALSSAFIPVFSDFLEKGSEQTAHKMASALFTLGLTIFLAFAVVLFFLAPVVLTFMNPGSGYSPDQMALMASLMRVIIAAQILFVVATFFSALLQSYNHFFVPGIAASLYNLGMIIGIVSFSSSIGIFAPAVGAVIGALIFTLAQLPMIRKIHFHFSPKLSWNVEGLRHVFHLMWPRTISIAIFQVGTLVSAALISFLVSPGRNYVIFDLAQTLAFAPVVLFGQTIAQAAFPVLSRQKDNKANFRITFATSMKQMLYIILPISVLILVLRIPVVRLVFGAEKFDWEATVLTGRTLAFFSFSIFSQALIALVSRGFYALHDTKTPLIVGGISTVLMVVLGYVFIVFYKFGIESLAAAFSIASIVNLVISLILLDIQTGGFDKRDFFFSMGKIFIATVCTGFALYVPIKLLDQLVVDTTRTVGLLLLTGISAFCGLSLYLFLTWLLNVKEASTFIVLFRKIGDWREILGMREEVMDTTRPNL